MFISSILFFGNLFYLKPDEQVVYTTWSDGSKHVNGPGITFISPEQGKQYRKGVLLDEFSYVKIINVFDGKRRKEVGPKMLFLGAYDKIEGCEDIPPGDPACPLLQKLILGQHEYVKIVNEENGQIRIVDGQPSEEKYGNVLVFEPIETMPFGVQQGTLLTEYESVMATDTTTGTRYVTMTNGMVFPGPYDVLGPKETGIPLSRTEYIRLRNMQTGGLRIVKGETVYFKGPFDEVIGEYENNGVRTGHVLTPDIALHVLSKDDGTRRLVRFGDQEEKVWFPGPYDELLEVRHGIKLSKAEWVRLMNEETGEVRIEIGEQVVFLGPTEVKIGDIRKGYHVNSEQALVVESADTGEQRLFTTPCTFFPSAYENVVAIRPLLRVEPHESVVIMDTDGAFKFYNPILQTAKGESFFLPPYHSLVTMYWSTGNPDEQDEYEALTKIDLRAQYLFFDFEVRTSDNVRLKIAGTVFWQVTDVQKMIRATRDTRGDIWHRSRNVLIAAVGSVKLNDFMEQLNDIVEGAFEDDKASPFYDDRGLMVHSMEVTQYETIDDSTSAVFEEIIRETTYRINRMEKQTSDNEVAEAKLRADVILEKNRTELLKTRADNEKSLSIADGENAGLKLAAGADIFINSLATEIPNITDRVQLYKLHQELAKRNMTSANLAKGGAQLFVAPQDMNLRLQMHEL
jgi:regulator of protease activity HflC (stomatin/prohibitin superfamily)